MLLFVVVVAVLVLAAALVFVLGAGIVGLIPLVLAVAVVGWMKLSVEKLAQGALLT